MRTMSVDLVVGNEALIANVLIIPSLQYNISLYLLMLKH